jgi:predicted RNA-binding protein with PIN domain
MSLLIDGYNLLNSVGIAAPGRGPGTLERSRLALLNFLAESVDPAQIERTTVVFDAREAPPGLPHNLRHRGLSVRFAARDQEADELIEELIHADSAPRNLTVVSSDHRLQKAAHRRKATAIDSDVWYADVIRQRRQRHEAAAAAGPERPNVPLLQEDVEYWVRQFGGPLALDRLAEGLDIDGPTPPGEPAAKGGKNPPGASKGKQR